MIKRGQGNLFVQDDWTDEFYLLTCTGVGDVSAPSAGAPTPVYCPDPEHSGEFIVDGYVYGETGLGSFTLTKPLATVFNFLLENRCGYNALITWLCEGFRDRLTDWEVAALAYNAVNSDTGISQPVATNGGDDDRVDTTATASFASLMMLYPLEWVQQSLSNTADANGIAFLPYKCQSDCSNERGLCEIGFIGLDGTQYNSEVKYTIDSGSTWTQTTADPFTYDGGNAGKPVIFDEGDTERLIVPRISLASGEYAEVAITENRGVSWTNVYVGTRVDQWLTKLFKYRGKVWASATNGFIYVSSDRGATWTAQEAGAETTETLNDICMYSELVGYSVGDDNSFLYTLSGGDDWASRTGPAPAADLLSVAVNERGYVYVGANDGNIYYSTDRGVTWNTRWSFGAGTVPFIVFQSYPRYVGIAGYNNGTVEGFVFQTLNGGATWTQLTSGWPDNAGINDGFVCDQNNYYVVGEAYDGQTFVAKASPA